MRTRNSCSETECEALAFGRGLCSPHYQKALYHGTLPAFREHACEQCGKVFANRKWNSIYCSPSCHHRASYRLKTAGRVRRTISCGQCGTSLIAKRIDARFCSEKCGTAFHNAEMALVRLANRKPCAHCGAPLPMGRQRFCSDACNMAHRRPEKYGLSRDELAALLAQHNACAICRTDHWGKKGPQIDHDHATDAIRGVLCSNCNQGLGRFDDDPARLRAAADYLTG